MLEQECQPKTAVNLSCTVAWGKKKVVMPESWANLAVTWSAK